MIHEEIKHVAIVGTGMIAVSMAVLLTGHGYRTTMLTRSEASRERALKTYRQYYQDLIDFGLVTQAQAERCSQFMGTTQDYQDISDADLVIESVYEQIDVKHAVYKQIESVCRPNAIIASVTSGIQPDKLAEGVRIKDRLIVAHPFMPPHIIPCVEIVKNEQTSPETVDQTIRFLESINREVVVLGKSIDGFIVNRLQFAMLREAINLVEQGVASAADIDRTILSSIGPRYSTIGLFEHLDDVGLDLVFGIQSYLNATLCNDTGAQPSLIDLVASNHLGSKSGKGFLDWSVKDRADLRIRRSNPFLRLIKTWQLPEAEAECN